MMMVLTVPAVVLEEVQAVQHLFVAATQRIANEGHQGDTSLILRVERIVYEGHRGNISLLLLLLLLISGSPVLLGDPI